MIDLQKHLTLLGLPVVDRVTGFAGVVTSVGFDLYGCIQAIVNPGIDRGTGAPRDSQWFDVNRLKVTGKAVMDRPEFEWSPEAVAAGRKGPAERPRTNKA